MNVCESLSFGGAFVGTVTENMLDWQQTVLIKKVEERVHILALSVKEAFIEKCLKECVSGNWCQK